MKKSTAVILLSSALLAGASCENRPDPPSAVEVRVPVPVPCRVPEPSCQAPAYDQATKAMEGDQKVKLLRAETASQADCVRLYREALAACREAQPAAPPR